MERGIQSIIGAACMVFLLTWVPSCARKTEPSQPNILFIMADDHTTQAISCYGGIFAEKAKSQHR
jgi:hypothetical protein